MGVIWEIILMPEDAIVFSIPLSSPSQPSSRPPAEEKQGGLTVSGRYFLFHPPLHLVSGNPDESVHELFIPKSKSREMGGRSERGTLPFLHLL